MNILLILELIVLTEASAPEQVGVNGEVSRYQISKIALLEVNENLFSEKEKMYITFENMKNESVAQFVARKYFEILRTVYKCNTTEKLVRWYNGGTNGHLKLSTKDYWQRFQNHAKQKGIKLK